MKSKTLIVKGECKELKKNERLLVIKLKRGQKSRIRKIKKNVKKIS